MRKFFILFLVGAALLTFQSGQAQSNFTSFSQSNSYTAGGQINWLKNYSDAVSQAQATSKPIAILFTGSNWCPACVQLERNVITHPDFAQAVSQRFVFLKADFPDYSESAVSTSPYKPLMDRYSVNAFPTLVIIDANGNMLFTVNYRQGGPQMYAQEMLQKLGNR